MRSRIFVSPLVGLLLTGCVTTGVSTRPDLPAVPQSLRECFVGVVDLPAQAEWDAETAARVIVKIRKSELSKTDCGQRLLAFYDNLRQGLRSP